MDFCCALWRQLFSKSQCLFENGLYFKLSFIIENYNKNSVKDNDRQLVVEDCETDIKSADV